MSTPLSRQVGRVNPCADACPPEAASHIQLGGPVPDNCQQTKCGLCERWTLARIVTSTEVIARSKQPFQLLEGTKAILWPKETHKED